MDEQVFDRLDALQRGDFGQEAARSYASECYARSSMHDRYAEAGYGDGDYGYIQNDFSDPHQALDLFDRELLRQPDVDSRHGQAVLGQARMSLPPAIAKPSVPRDFQPPDEVPHSLQRPNLSRFAFHPEHGGHDGPLPTSNPVTSSSSYGGSHREIINTDDFQSFPRSSRASQARGLGLDTDLLSGEPSLHARNGNHQPGRPGISTTGASSRGGNPVVQGIQQASTRELPDRFRSIFPFPLFNAVQSKCFDTIYKTDDNFVLSSPTGSGKTAVLELAICRLMANSQSGSYKIIYQAPTKALCSERQRDWQAKFGPFDLQCAELTGDTETAELKKVQQASIIVTTPEKWDSITRRWKDHQKLMQMVKLFLIDEVHILKEDRGATLEAVVSRMKSVGSAVRFVALSATIPNSEDVATWLGKDAINSNAPAAREHFGEDFRPVRLQKHVCAYNTKMNDFGFDKFLNSKLPEVIERYSRRKPLLVFCFTRTACIETANVLAKWSALQSPQQRYWPSSPSAIAVGDKALRDIMSAGVAFHHAGLASEDRIAIEKAYLQGHIGVICCTSTLAVGVNLPCHMVIIKGTVTYQQSVAGPGTCKQYSDLEIMQMLGRAGRPQFDDSAVAVIMTQSHLESHYEKMMTSQEVLESCLHRNLIEHVNAEIGLGTVTSASSARKWLRGTFLHVRLKENPRHYKLDDIGSGRTLDERVENICDNAIAQLEKIDIVRSGMRLECTVFGHAMARYYVQLDTMKTLLVMQPKAKVSEILSVIAGASEFKDIRFRQGEKGPYKELNENSATKFPLPGPINHGVQKVSLIIQSVLGAIDFAPTEWSFRQDYNSNRAAILQHSVRLVRCIIDCQIYLEDSVTVRNALMLHRSLVAQVWDDSPLHMKQLANLGVASVRKLVAAGITTIENLQNSEAHRLEHVLSRNPPFGHELQAKARGCPSLRISVSQIGQHTSKKNEGINVRVRAEIGFLNEKLPLHFNQKSVWGCLLIERSDGHLIHFARVSAKSMDGGHEVLFNAILTSPDQTVRGYVMGDGIAGTQRLATLKPDIPAQAFPPPETAAETRQNDPGRGTSIRLNRPESKNSNAGTENPNDEFDDDDLDDAALVSAEKGDFIDIDEFESTHPKASKAPQKQQENQQDTIDETWQPRQLANGKWACSHSCKDKTKCKHFCCREGTEKKPKPPKAKASKTKEPSSDPRQTQLPAMISKSANAKQPLSDSNTTTPQRKGNEFREVKSFHRLHGSVKSLTQDVPAVSKARASPEHSSVLASARMKPSFLQQSRAASNRKPSSDYGQNPFSSDEFPVDPVVHIARHTSPQMSGTMAISGDDDMLDAADEDPDTYFPPDIQDDDLQGDMDLPSLAENYGVYTDFNQLQTSPEDEVPTEDASPEKHKSTFITGDNSTSAPPTDPALAQQGHEGHKRALIADDASQPVAKKQKRASSLHEAMNQVIAEAGFGNEPLLQQNAGLSSPTQMPQPAASTEPTGDKDFDLQEWFNAELGTEHFNLVD